MKVMVIGSGGREHAIVWKLSQSPKVSEIICAPGNAGISKLAKCVPLDTDDIDGLVNLAVKEGIDLTVVGPELPLTLGIVDLFEENGLKIFGPSKEAAQLEGSKCFSKRLLDTCYIPTAKSAFFTNISDAHRFIAKRKKFPIVVKADGLASGKGVFVCSTKESAYTACESCMLDGVFGAAGQKILIEDFLDGEEVSFMVITDGNTILPLVPVKDYKKAYDGDKGPNTGGMGSYSPPDLVSGYMQDKIIRTVIRPILRALRRKGIIYKGVLYAGLMIKGEGIKVLEFNCRFGDPETQALLMRLDSDLLDIFLGVVEKSLKSVDVKWSKEKSVCVVLASKDYPYKADHLNKIILPIEDNHTIFHSSTRKDKKDIVSNGGRILSVVFRGNTIREAADSVYQMIKSIKFSNKIHYRKDIGK